MILFTKEGELWVANCKGHKKNRVKDCDINYILDSLVMLDEGITLRTIRDIFLKYPKLFDFNNQIETLIKESCGEVDTINVSEYEYVSLIPNYDLLVFPNLKSNNVTNIISKLGYVSLQIENIHGGTVPIFNDMFCEKNILELEVRIERESVLYDNIEYLMPNDVNLLEMINAFGDTILYYDEDDENADVDG
jgi:hypothetical protein